MTIRTLVHRKTRDLVRDAAEDVLLRHTPALKSVDRAELWTFTGADGVRGDVQRVLDETTLVVNPNIHRYRVLESAASPPAAGSRVTLIVRDRVDAKGASVLRSVRERLGFSRVTGVARAVQWTIELDAPRSAAEKLVQAVTGQDGRGAGLLANPHSQDVESSVEGA